MESKLEQAARYVRTGRRIIAAQRLQVAAIQEKGGDTTDAKQLLSLFEQPQEIFEAHLEMTREAIMMDSPGPGIEAHQMVLIDAHRADR